MEQYREIFEALILDGMTDEQARVEVIKTVQADFDYLPDDKVEANIVDVLDYLGI